MNYISFRGSQTRLYNSNIVLTEFNSNAYMEIFCTLVKIFGSSIISFSLWNINFLS